MPTASFIPGVSHSPYADPSLNAIYNLMFCDDVTAFAPKGNGPMQDWQRTLLAARPDAEALRALADDDQSECRVRALAYGRLRQMGHAVAPRQLLGVIFEVPMEGGLDVLAAYPDGSIRYLNHAAAPTLIEGPMAHLQPIVERIMAAAKRVVDCIGPTDQPRRPAPSQNVRLSFLVSDGLYFGEGPMAALSQDGMAGPLLAAGGELLASVVEMVVERSRKSA